MSGLFILKIGFGFIFFAVYYFYYGNNRFTSDAFRFYDDALVIYNTLPNNPIHYLRLMFSINLEAQEMQPYLNEMNFWTKDFTHGLFNDNQTIIRVNAFFDLFSFGYYHVHTIFMCFISLIGLTALYKSMLTYVNELKPIWFAAVFLIPSTLFWGSGVLKEGVILFSLGCFIYSSFKLLDRFSLKHFILGVSTLFILLFLKVYIIIALVPALIGYTLIYKAKKFKVYFTYPLIILLGVAVALLVHNRVPSIDIIAKLSHKQFDFINMVEKQDANSMFELTRLNNSPIEFFMLAPEAVINSIFRPFIWESNSPFMLFNSIENLSIFCIGVLLLFFKRIELNWNLIGFSIIFVLLLYLFIGWVTPISGAIVRYKIPAWPFFILIFTVFADGIKLQKNIPLLKKLNDKLT